MSEREKIPNFNTFSCLMDRITIEQVKKTIFELKQEEEGKDYGPQIKTQEKALKELREVFLDFCLKAWCTCEYEYLDDARTFQ